MKIIDILFRLFTSSYLVYNPNIGGGGFNPPSSGNKGGGAGSINNPALITSTGGLNGSAGILMAPAINTITGKSVIVYFNPNDFNCEESAEYDYRQEADYGQIAGEGRTCSIHLIILKYRELGYAKFNINITVFDRTIDDFTTVSIPVSIPVKPLKSKTRQANFPDKRIHTVYIYPPKGTIQGERPQVTITRSANAGSESVTRLTLCGDADELPQA